MSSLNATQEEQFKKLVSREVSAPNAPVVDPEHDEIEDREGDEAGLGELQMQDLDRTLSEDTEAMRRLLVANEEGVLSAINGLQGGAKNTMLSLVDEAQEAMKQEAESLKGFVQMMVERDRDAMGAPSLLDAERQEALSVLKRVLLNFGARDQYLVALRDISGGTFDNVDDKENKALASKVVNEGVDGLTNSEIAYLLVRPVDLCQFANNIHEDFPESWWSEMEIEGHRVMDEHGMEIPKLEE